MLLLDLVYKNFPYIIHILSSHPPDGYWWWGLNNLGLALEVTGWREQKCYDLRSLMTVWGSAPHPPIPSPVSMYTYLPRLTVRCVHKCTKIFYSINPLNYWSLSVVVVTAVSLPCKYVDLENNKISGEIRRRDGEKKNSQWSRKRTTREVGP